MEQALVEVHDGVAGAHLGGMESNEDKKLDSRGLAGPKRCIVTAIDV